MVETSGLYRLLYSSALLFPNETALISGVDTCSYHELNVRAEQLSNLLLSLNVGKGNRVAICLPKSIEFVASIFGILKAGAAYLPLDKAAPDERNRFIIENSDVQAIIINEEQLKILPDIYNIKARIDNGSILAIRNSPSKKSIPDLAYILYTSGSTGEPKGVMITENAALKFINWSVETFHPKQNDRFASHAPFHFDLSVFDLFVSIKQGASLVLIDEAISRNPILLSQLISEKKITIWYSTPTILNMLSLYGKMYKYDYDQLRLVLFAGEVYPVKRFQTLKLHWPTAEYYNLFGPTETNVCTFFKIPNDITSFSNNFPIGRCCSHYRAMIIGDETTGELCISGDGLFAGYWNATETDSLFIDEAGSKWYRTGDIVSIDKDGNFIFRDRNDRMVKRNGYRIELAEIETALTKNELINECAVLSQKDANEDIIITAFICTQSIETQSEIKMKEYCKKHLPAYMIPDTFIFLEKLPQTSSNKTDLQVLKQLL
ncbi:MAG: acyl-CoA synthetase [Bacteroidetes bacterium]|jgi:amino acid adenylation domain-containing protein|nr:acyl-CoA synthetase [Bacteroidota bacterium]